MHLQSTEESHNKLNPSSTTTHGQTCCFACSCYGPLPPSAVACAKIAQIILGSPAQSGDPRFAQQNPRMVRIHTVRSGTSESCYGCPLFRGCPFFGGRNVWTIYRLGVSMVGRLSAIRSVHCWRFHCTRESLSVGPGSSMTGNRLWTTLRLVSTRTYTFRE